MRRQTAAVVYRHRKRVTTRNVLVVVLGISCMDQRDKSTVTKKEMQVGERITLHDGCSGSKIHWS